MANLSHKVSDQTVGNILKRHDIPPAPKRKQSTSWKDFIRAHMASSVPILQLGLTGQGLSERGTAMFSLWRILLFARDDGLILYNAAQLCASLKALVLLPPTLSFPPYVL